MELNTWFEREMLPVIAASGCFGSDKLEISKCEVKSLAKGDDHFTSSTLFVHLEIEFPNGASQTRDMVLKLPPEDQVFQKYIGTHARFLNEVIMYTETIPSMENFLGSRNKVSLNDYDLFPDCYYAKWENKSGAVAIQDLRPLGYQVCEDRIILDYDHCEVLLKALGRYHAISYGMKKLAPSSFFHLTKKFEDAMFGEDIFYKIVVTRSVEYLERKQQLDEESLERFKNSLNNPFKLMKDLVVPKEPLTVLCHGDFCRNNVLFTYDDGKPSKVKFFDFQAVRYASPAIDLTFFCFMNTTSEFRAKHWDDMLRIYHDSLVQSLADILECPVFEVESIYSLENIKNEFRDHAFYGFILCDYFLPEMIAGPVEQINHDEMARRTLEELAEIYLKIGGDDATVLVADVVKDMAKMGAF